MIAGHCPPRALCASIAEKGGGRIEWTPKQPHELTGPEPGAIDRETKQTYVLIPKEVNERLGELLYDDTSWTDEEMDLLAGEVDALQDEDMAMEDTAPAL